MTPQPLTTDTVAYIKDIRRNRQNRDWDVFLTYTATNTTEYLGSRDSRVAAEQLVDDHVARLCRAGLFPTI